jgi:hypothetical protein
MKDIRPWRKGDTTIHGFVSSSLVNRLCHGHLGAL